MFKPIKSIGNFAKRKSLNFAKNNSSPLGINFNVNFYKEKRDKYESDKFSQKIVDISNIKNPINRNEAYDSIAKENYEKIMKRADENLEKNI